MRMATHHAAPVPSPQARRPAIQKKVQIGPVDDPLEREADRIADAVVSDRPVGPVTGASAGAVQRKCEECEEEDEGMLQRKSAAGASAGHVPQEAAAAAAMAVAHGGTPLTAEQRAYFEPRFGRDFSDVRVHLNGQAASAAEGVKARAFAFGRHFAFARSEYRPETSAGRHLLAHELAHVAQQQEGAMSAIRRATYGTGTPPVFSDSTWAVVPEEEQTHVDEAIALVDAVAADSLTYSECHDQFAERCPGGNRGTLAAIWNRARIWKVTSPDPGTRARAPTGGSDIGYTPKGYGQSPMDFATTLMHEAGHNCGIPGGDTHWHARLISNYCMGPSRNAISISGSLSGTNPLAIFSYRRFLGDWAGGRLRATLGVDLNTITFITEIAESGSREETRLAGEFGSAMVGVHARLGGWGGTRYGGFAFRVETGFGVGRFNLRPAAPGEARVTDVRPDWILQVGPRAEFLVKDPFSTDEEGGVIPFSIGAALRLAVPLNGEAQALQGAVFSLEFPL